MLVHVLPVALLAPWWARPTPRPGGLDWGRWYLSLEAAGVALGAAIALAWALPAAARGGQAYRAADPVGADGGANLVPHIEAFRAPAAMVVVSLAAAAGPLPVGSVAAALAIAGAPGRGAVDLPARFALAWVVPGLIALSTSSAASRSTTAHSAAAGIRPPRERHACSRGGEPARRRDNAAPAGLLALAGVVLVIGGTLRPSAMPRWLSEVSPGWDWACWRALLLALAKGGRGQALALSLTCPLLLIGVHLAGSAALARSFDLEPVAAILKAGEQASGPSPTWCPTRDNSTS